MVLRSNFHPYMTLQLPRTISHCISSSFCRISWMSSGLQGIENDGSSQFQCSLDHIGPGDGHIMNVEVFTRGKCICGLRLHYVSKKTVEHGDCTSSLIKSTGILFTTDEGFILVCASDMGGRPQSIEFGSSNCRVSNIKSPEQSTWSRSYGTAPRGIFWEESGHSTRATALRG